MHLMYIVVQRLAFGTPSSFGLPPRVARLDPWRACRLRGPAAKQNMITIFPRYSSVPVQQSWTVYYLVLVDVMTGKQWILEAAPTLPLL